ncbi:unnamed protein product [Leuciscus chuanchicus]
MSEAANQNRSVLSACTPSALYYSPKGHGANVWHRRVPAACHSMPPNPPGISPSPKGTVTCEPIRSQIMEGGVATSRQPATSPLRFKAVLSYGSANHVIAFAASFLSQAFTAAN